MLSFFRLLLTLTIFVATNSYADLSLKDLGVDTTSAEFAPKLAGDQITMERRHSMLKSHEVLGLTTLGVMTATMLTGGSAVGSDVHMYLGITSGALYFSTALLAFTAPKPAGIKDRGAIKWHKRLAWIHFPAMLMAPVLGYMYKKNEEDGKKSSSLVKQHSAIAGVGFGAFALSAALMTFEF